MLVLYHYRPNSFYLYHQYYHCLCYYCYHLQNPIDFWYLLIGVIINMIYNISYRCKCFLLSSLLLLLSIIVNCIYIIVTFLRSRKVSVSLLSLFLASYKYNYHSHCSLFFVIIFIGIKRSSRSVSGIFFIITIIIVCFYCSDCLYCSFCLWHPPPYSYAIIITINVTVITIIILLLLPSITGIIFAISIIVIVMLLLSQ